MTVISTRLAAPSQRGALPQPDQERPENQDSGGSQAVTGSAVDPLDFCPAAVAQRAAARSREAAERAQAANASLCRRRQAAARAADRLVARQRRVDERAAALEVLANTLAAGQGAPFTTG